jgi:hypothetical protein
VKLWQRLLFFTLFLVVSTRLFFGIDFTDESYWVVMALRFAQGAQPFVDELFINQTASLLISPFIWIYLKLFGSTEGIILFSRFLYLALSIAVALVVIPALSKRLPKEAASLIAAAVVAIVPLQIPNLGYNSLGSLLFTAGLFFHLNRYWGGSPFCSFGAGLCHFLCVFAYPSLLIPVAGVVLFLRLYSAHFFAGILTAALFTLPAIFSAGSSLGNSLQYSIHSFDHGGGARKIFVVLEHFFVSNVRLRMFVPVLFLFIVYKKGSNLFRSLAFLLFPPLFFFCFFDLFYVQMWIVFYAGALAAVLYPFVRQHLWARDLFRLVALPSFLAALVIGWTSSSAPINGVLGLLPAFLVSTSFLWALAPPQIRLQSQAIWVAVLVTALFHGKAFYRDGDLFQLTSRVSQGPFRFLMTTPQKLRYLEEVTADIRKYENSEGRVVFYEFPAGYLISKMQAGVNSTWMRTISRGKSYYTKYYQDHFHPKNLVFEMVWLTHEKPQMQYVEYKEHDEFHKFLVQTHEPLLVREEYAVLAPKR